MPGDYRERLKEAEALVQRARNERERAAFEEIVAIWRRLAASEPRPDPASQERPA